MGEVTSSNCTYGVSYNVTTCGPDPFNASSVLCNVTLTSCPPPSRDVEFALSLAVNVGLWAAFLCWFLFFKKRVPQLFEPLSDPKKAGRRLVDPPEGGLLGWMYAIFRVSDKELATTRGLDSVVYLAFLKYCFWMAAAMSFFGCAMLMPAHWFSSDLLAGLERLTMANVPDGSPIFTVDVISVFINTIICNVGLFLLYKRYAHLRLAYLRRHATPETFAIMLRECHATEDDIYKAFDQVFPGKVQSVRLAYRTKWLWWMIRKREKIGLKAERAQAKELKGKKMYATNCEAGNCFICCGRKLEEPSEFFTIRFHEVEEAIRFRQDNHEHTPAGTAFVLFKDRITAQLAVRAQTNFKAIDYRYPLQKSWNVDPAPSLRTVNWEWLHVPHMDRWIRSLIVNAATLLLIFFWMVPVTFVASFTNLQTLSRVPVFSWLLPLVELWPVLLAFIEGFLPGLAFLLFNFILYDYIITPLARVECQPSTLITQRSIFNKYFLFQVFNTFLGSVLANGALSVVQEIINNPASIVPLLANSVPGNWPTFLSIVMINGLANTASDLANVGGVIKFYLLRFFSVTKRDLRKAEALDTFDYASAYADHLLTFLIMVNYSTLAPIVVIFSAIYFGLYLVYHRYLITFVWYPDEPGEGLMFPAIYTRCCWSLIVYQAVIGGSLGLKVFPGGVAIFVLLIIQLCVWVWTDKTFHDMAKFGPLYVPKQPRKPNLMTRLRTKVRSSFKLPVSEGVELGDHIDTLIPHPDTFKYPTLRDDYDFSLEDQRPEFVYDYPWPDCPNGIIDMTPEWVPRYDDETTAVGESSSQARPDLAIEMTSVDLKTDYDPEDYLERRDGTPVTYNRRRGELFLDGQLVRREGIRQPLAPMPQRETDTEIELGESFLLSSTPLQKKAK